MIATFTKAPAENLDYDIDFSLWLEAGDALDTAQVTQSADLVIGTIDVAADAVKVWISGGTANADAEIMVTATTAAGRIKRVPFNIKVRE